jgi:dienelactone hydrolase
VRSFSVVLRYWHEGSFMDDFQSKRNSMKEQKTSSQDVSGAGFVGRVHRPDESTGGPAILLVGGSSGGIGWQDLMAAELARRGFVALALAYVRMDGLPQDLERIPLEYFDRAIDWVSDQVYVDQARLGIGGVSKGGELALLLASMHPEIKAVAAFVPSGVVFQSITAAVAAAAYSKARQQAAAGAYFPRTSSWTYCGVDVPFVAYGHVKNPCSVADFYLAGLEQAESLDPAVIKVERINGPILLLTGTDDKLWPSTKLSEMIVARLAEKGFPHEIQHFAYENAGHLIASVSKNDVIHLGGTREGNSRAQQDGRQRFLSFFERHLRSTPPCGNES